MTFHQLLNELIEKKVHLFLNGQELRYKAQPGTITEELKNKMRFYKDELIRHLSSNANEAVTLPQIQKRTDTAPAEMSYAQRRLWILDQLDPGNPAYNTPIITPLDGPVNMAHLEKALNAIVMRHETLRTVFYMENGKPVQVVVPRITVPIEFSNLCTLPNDQRSTAVIDRINALIGHRFDLKNGPLLKAAAMCVSETKYLLVIVKHHIITDGWSMGVFANELQKLYKSYDSGMDAGLAPLEIQYADFSDWQKGWLQGDVLKKQLAFWSEQIGSLVNTCGFPTDNSRGNKQSFTGDVFYCFRDKNASKELNEFCKVNSLTPFMVMNSALSILISKYSHETDVAIGTPVANRNDQKLNNLIGFIVNTLVIRTKVDYSEKVLQYLQRMRTITVNALSNQDIPFEYLVDQFAKQRDMSKTPFFQVMLAYQNFDDSELVGSNSYTEGRTRYAKYDITLSVFDSTEGQTFEWEYNKDLYVKNSIEQIALHFFKVLDEIIKNASSKIGDIDLLTSTERNTYLFDWNATAKEYTHGCLHELFQIQAKKTPHAIAVRYKDQALTYEELDRKSDLIASFLIKQGVVVESVVGVCIERSLEMVLALYGILKAGGAYLPIDPNYPEERKRYQLQDSNTKICLTDSKSSAIIDYLNVRTFIVSDVVNSCVKIEETCFPSVKLINAAYVIYTSGSTGKPKGVINSHLGISNRLFWMQDYFQLMPEDKVLQKTTYCFDVSVWEIFWPLLTGACLVMAVPGGHMDPSYLANTIDEEKITTIHFVPAMLDEFLQTPNIKKASGLKRLICSGEALLPATVSKCEEILGVPVFNLYGPTEAAVDVTFWRCGTPSKKSGCIPIGNPISNICMYVLDDNFDPVPPNVDGEIYIGGIGVARGYINKSRMTADRFIPDPFSTVEGGRLYRTGDIGRFKHDGTLEYIGRADGQVKIRGLRIELQEIEIMLETLPGIEQAIVAVDGSTKDKRLVGFVKANKDDIDPDLVKMNLRKLVPDYMVPSFIIQVDCFPLNSNGKIDRKKLLADNPVKIVRKTEFVEVKSDLEKLIKSIWASELPAVEIGVTDNFFDLGGNSLLSIRVIEKLRAELKQEIALVKLYEYPTIRELSTFLEGNAVFDKSIVETRVNQAKVGRDRLTEQMNKRRKIKGQEIGV